MLKHGRLVDLYNRSCVVGLDVEGTSSKQTKSVVNLVARVCVVLLSCSAQDASPGAQRHVGDILDHLCKPALEIMAVKPKMTVHKMCASHSEASSRDARVSTLDDAILVADKPVCVCGPHI